MFDTNRYIEIQMDSRCLCNILSLLIYLLIDNLKLCVQMMFQRVKHFQKNSNQKQPKKTRMSAPPDHSTERQPLHDDPDPQDPDLSLIQSGRAPGESSRNGYYTDPIISNSLENPYCDTTESDTGLRHVTMSEVIPRPWLTYRQIEIAAYISVVFFLITGIFAVKFVRRARLHQSKGLMGMAQRDLRLTVRLIYASAVLGIILYFIIIPVAAS